MTREVSCLNPRCSYFELSDIHAYPAPGPNCLYCGHKLHITHIEPQAQISPHIRTKMDLAFSEREFDELDFEPEKKGPR